MRPELASITSELDAATAHAKAIAERADAYRAAARIVATDVPYFVLSYQGHQLFHQRRVVGLETSPRGMLRSLAGATLN